MITRFAGAIATALTASLGLASSALAAPKVAVDIAPVHALVARVMEGVGEPALIIPPEATPHAYSLRPSEASALERADMVVWIGAELTPWLEGSIDTLAGDAHVIPLLGAGGSSMREFREGLAFAAAEPHNEDHGEGHEHDAHGHDDHGHDDHAHDEHAHEDTRMKSMRMTITGTRNTRRKSTGMTRTPSMRMITGMPMTARIPMPGSTRRMRAPGSR